MTENRSLETHFLWGIAAALGFVAILHWLAYFTGSQTWVTAWPAIPFTVAALLATAGALVTRRRAQQVRLESGP